MDVIDHWSKLLERFNTIVLGCSCGSKPLKRLKLKSNLGKPINLDKNYKRGMEPLIWLLERFKYLMLEERSQNQWGMVYEIVALNITRHVIFFCVRSHWGKAGPTLQELNLRISRWNDGTQAGLKFNDRGLKEKFISFKMERFSTCASVITPSKEFEDTSRTSSLESFPILLVKLLFNRFLCRCNLFKQERLARSVTSPLILLFDKSSTCKLWRFLKVWGITPSRSLKERLRWTRATIFPKASGRGPSKRLASRERTTRLLEYLNSQGNTDELRWLTKRSRNKSGEEELPTLESIQGLSIEGSQPLRQV